MIWLKTVDTEAAGSTSKLEDKFWHLTGKAVGQGAIHLFGPDHERRRLKYRSLCSVNSLWSYFCLKPQIVLLAKHFWYFSAGPQILTLSCFSKPFNNSDFLPEDLVEWFLQVTGDQGFVFGELFRCSTYIYVPHISMDSPTHSQSWRPHVAGIVNCSL